MCLDLPRPFMHRETLRDLIAPTTGDRILEVGTGTSYYTLDVAATIGTDGRLDALDLRQ